MAEVRFDPDALSPGDAIEYMLTQEISPGPGQRAWVKFGTISTVKADEDPAEAVQRVAKFVEDGLDARIDGLS